MPTAPMPSADRGQVGRRGEDARKRCSRDEPRRHRNRLSPDRNGLHEGKEGDGRVPPGAGAPARRQPRLRRALVSAARRASCSRRETASSRSTSGNFPTSRANGTSRSASSSTCRTRSTISTMRRPASSRPIRKAASPISTPRWPNGWASTSPSSARLALDGRRHRGRGHGAGPVGQGRSGHDAQRRHRPRPRKTERPEPAGALHAPRDGDARRRAGTEARTIVLKRDAGRGFLRRSQRLEVRFTRFFNITPMAIASASTPRGASCAPMRRSCRSSPASSTATRWTAGYGSTR